MSYSKPEVRAQEEAEAAAFGDGGKRVLAIRLKESLRDRLNEIAKQRNTSLNQMVRKLLLDFANQQEPTDAE